MPVPPRTRTRTGPPDTPATTAAGCRTLGHVATPASGELLDAVRTLLSALSDERFVHTACEPVPEPSPGPVPPPPADPAELLAGDVLHRLVLRVDQEWSSPADRREPLPTARETVAALTKVRGHPADELVTRLSVRGLVWGDRLRNVRRARGDAHALVTLLGPDAVWFTTFDAGSADALGTSVTRQTFDGAVAGVGAGLVAVLLQVGED